MIRDWEPWFDAHGFVSNTKPGKQTHNGLMFTAHYVYWLYNALNDCYAIGDFLSAAKYREEIYRIRKLYDSCWVPNGGFKRAPSGWTSKVLNQNDDYYGICLVSALSGEDFAGRALDTMIDNYGCLNDQEPGKFSWKSFLFRMPQLTITMALADRRKIGVLLSPLWLLWLYSSLLKGNRDSNIKAWMAARTALGVHRVLDYPIWWFLDLWKAKNKGVGQREYFTSDHPIEVFMEDWI